jgi:hypothetical protein
VTDRIVQDERRAFASRLAKAFQDAGVQNSATVVARQYNLHTGANITVHAARKWLCGESIPRQEHLAGLSRWLHCDTAWLRYGTGGEPVANGRTRGVQDTVLLRDLSRLDERSKQLVRTLVDALVKMQLEDRRTAAISGG